MSEIYQSAREIRSEVRVLPVSIVHNGIPAQKRTSAAMEEEGRKRRREMISLVQRQFLLQAEGAI